MLSQSATDAVENPRCKALAPAERPLDVVRWSWACSNFARTRRTKMSNKTRPEDERPKRDCDARGVEGPRLLMRAFLSACLTRKSGANHYHPAMLRWGASSSDDNVVGNG